MAPTVPPPACPSCQSTATGPLESVSRFTDREYFRCVRCGHIWSQPKPQGGRPTGDDA
jgi:hypothetical protein